MKKRSYFFNLILIMGPVFLIGCSNYGKSDREDIPIIYDYGNSENIETILQIISENNIYFGHQSVGYNILDGIKHWINETGVSVKLIESREYSDIDDPSFTHFQIGENLNPKLKTDDFYNFVSNIDQLNRSLVFFKFCYVDILRTTNVDSIFNYYKKRMLILKDKYPYHQMVLFTLPLTSIQKGFKVYVKKIIYGPTNQMADNIKRNEFNNRILEELGNEFPVFDLARIEGTLPDGKMNTFTHKGKSYLALYNEYTTDGGHLNEKGSQIVAYNLLAFLAEEIQKNK